MPVRTKLLIEEIIRPKELVPTYVRFTTGPITVTKTKNNEYDDRFEMSLDLTDFIVIASEALLILETYLVRKKCDVFSLPMSFSEPHVKDVKCVETREVDKTYITCTVELVNIPLGQLVLKGRFRVRFKLYPIEVKVGELVKNEEGGFYEVPVHLKVKVGSPITISTLHDSEARWILKAGKYLIDVPASLTVELTPVYE